MAGQPFDLAAEIPLRARLLRLGPAEHVLVVVLHHIAGDGWSMGAAGPGRVGRLRGPARRGRAPDWEPLPVQYADYALWQRELLGDDDDPGSLLAAQVGVLAAGAGRGAGGAGPARRPAAARRWPATAGTAAALSVPAGVHAAAGGAGQGAGRDAVHGGAGRAGGAAGPAGRRRRTSRSARRSRAAPTRRWTTWSGSSSTPWCCAPTCPGTRRSPSCWRRVREAGLGALDHQDVPFERLVEVLAPDRSLARHPLFQVMLAVQNNAAPAWTCPACRPRCCPPRRRRRFDLEFVLAETIGAAGGPPGFAGW